MKNKHLTIFMLVMMVAVSMCGTVWAEGGEEDELSGFELFEKLRGMRLEAQSAMAKEDYVEAAKIYRRMARYEKNRARSAAYLLRGADCLMQAKKSHRALEEYTNLMENYPLYIPYEHVVEQLRQLAEWFIVGDGTFLGIRDKDAGIKIYELIIREAPSMHVTLNDRLRLAELLVESGRGEEAVVVYQALLRQEMDNWDVHAKLALLFLKLSKNGDGDGAKLRAAVREANLVIQNSPNHPKIKELKKLCKDADNEDANRILQQGEFYLVPAHSRPSSARRYFHDVILKYPESSAAKKAQHYLKSNSELRALEEAQNAKPLVGSGKKEPEPPKAAPAGPLAGGPSQPKVAPVPQGGDKKEAEHRKQEEAKRKEFEKARLAQEEHQRKEAEKAKMKREAEEARLREKKDKERREAEKKAEKARLAEEAVRREAAEKAAKLKAKREEEEARQREKQEKERQKQELASQKQERERQEQERKRLEAERRKADKAAKARAKTEEGERERIEKARVKAESQLRDGSKSKSEPKVKMVTQDKKKQEEAKRQVEEELKRIRERKARMMQQDPKLLEEEQKRLRELMENNRKTR